MSRQRKVSRPGFSLIELLLVLVILSILAGAVALKFTGRSEQARKTVANTDISQIATALDAFEVDNGRYPSSDEGLGALINAPGNVKNWQGPYLKKGVPKDPWGNPYVYRFPGQHNASGYDLYSTGPDGQDSAGDNINNWVQN
jgi:general secretion pathway protein G